MWRVHVACACGGCVWRIRVSADGRGNNTIRRLEF